MTGTGDNLAGMLLVLVPALPLAAALLGYLAAARNRGSLLPAWLGGVGLLGSTGLTVWLLRLLQGMESGAYFKVPWLRLPDVTRADGLDVPLAFYGNNVQLLFCLTTAAIGLAVLIFAGRERRGDDRRGVFFSTLTLFAGAMLLFLAADTLLVIYIAWELMGLCSYLLIAHPGTQEAWRAARQAFWTTRATDFGLLFAVIILMSRFNVAVLSDVNVNHFLRSISDPALVTGVKSWLTLVAILLVVAVIGKAAMFPLCFWLPDAMVAPAPVSALLHAATMVAAGPYLLIRLSKIFPVSETTLILPTLAGGLTMLVGAVMALSAREPKRILAYSTVSHLGLVVMSVGVLAEENGYFHLLAHAWFKAALFLAVGYLVAAWAAENNKDGHGVTLTAMAGYARRHPFVLWGILVPAGISLAGVPFFAGALGKEQILHALLTRYNVMPVQESTTTIGSQFPVAEASWLVGSMMMVLALPLTAAYITRLVGILGFAGKAKNELPGTGGLVTGSRPDGWSLPLGLAGLLALVGSIGLAVFYYAWFSTPVGFGDADALWRFADARQDPRLVLTMAVALLALLVGAGFTWHLRVANPAAGDRLFRDGGLKSLADFFAHGMYLRELFTTVVGRTGEFLAILAGIADIGFLDWLVLRFGAAGRLLAAGLRWVDEHVIDGLRWAVCEVVWLLKRLHARTLQTGQIQYYMLVVLVSTVILCFVVLRPLGDIMARIFGS